MTNRTLMLTYLAVGVPWLAMLLTAALSRHVRTVGFSASMVSLAASSALMKGTTPSESLNAALMVLFSCLTAGSMLVLPRRDATPRVVAGTLFLQGATLLGYSTSHLLILFLAWVLTAIPFFRGSLFAVKALRPQVSLVFSAACFAVAIGLVAASRHSLAIEQLRGQSPGGMPVFWLLVLAVILRKGICPAHAWVADIAESAPAIPTALFLNGHFGALLVAKLIVPVFPDTARTLFPVLSYLALATALYVAVRALSENGPRRLLAFLALSQSACILAGLESRTIEGITGALVHWMVVAISTMGLFSVLRLLEVRFGENLSASTHLGLGEHAPRLAVFFLVFGLALVGLPGTLSFCSQDLLIHGTLKSHPLTGLLLPVATAMNAISIFRLFARLFLGKRHTGFTVQADALPREQWALATGMLFVALAGLIPGPIVALKSAEAGAVVEKSKQDDGLGLTSRQGNGSRRPAGVADSAIGSHRAALAQPQ